jgi:O-methyltransferase
MGGVAERALTQLSGLGTDSILFSRGLQLRHRYRDFTMVGYKTYAANIGLLKHVQDVPGCVVECGVWRGGMIAGISEVLGPERRYYLFDSFEGMPPADELDGASALAYQQDKDSPTYYDNCRAEVDFARRAMAISKAPNVEYVPGWFADTLPGFVAPGGIALLRLDGDWYDSTMQCLTTLYPQVVPGGLVIIDDYYAWEGCSKAVHDYLSQTKSAERLRSSNGVCYMIKSQSSPDPQQNER